MILIPIFTSQYSSSGLWSIRLFDGAITEFEKFFERVNDAEWLFDFFEKNKDDLQSGFFGQATIRNAISITLDEAGEMENTLYEYSEQGFQKGTCNLQHLFKPLNNHEYAVVSHQKSKARIKKGWLRLYAIRLTGNCYLVTGGAIKLTPDMRRTHLQYELKKLEKVKQFLRDHGIDFPEDLNTFKDE